MAKFFARVVSAFQETSADPRTNVLSFETVVDWMRSIQGPLLPLVRLSLGGSTLSRAAAFTTFMASTVERRAANASALGCFFNALMADCRRGRPPTSAFDLSPLHARGAFPGVAFLRTAVVASKLLQAHFRTFRDRIFARCAWFVRDER